MGGTEGETTSRSQTVAIQDTHLLMKHKQKVKSLRMAREKWSPLGSNGIQQKQFCQGFRNLSSPGQHATSVVN